MRVTNSVKDYIRERVAEKVADRLAAAEKAELGELIASTEVEL